MLVAHLRLQNQIKGFIKYKHNYKSDNIPITAASWQMMLFSWNWIGLMLGFLVERYTFMFLKPLFVA